MNGGVWPGFVDETTEYIVVIRRGVIVCRDIRRHDEEQFNFVEIFKIEGTPCSET